MPARTVFASQTMGDLISRNIVWHIATSAILEGDVAPMIDDLGTDLDQSLARRPVGDYGSVFGIARIRTTLPRL
jgi:hypothetical protein